MKRKYLAIIYLLLLSLGTILSLYIPKNAVTANDAVVIPSDAIRLRILANSDSAEDQALKRLVRDEVNKEITRWVSELTSKEEAREVIKSGLPEIEKIAEKVVAEQNSDQDVKVEFGQVEFPTKLYGEFLYPAGKYEAILITLGEGVGANWWCVLFPPLCFLDFSNGVAVSQGFNEEETAEKAEAKENDKAEKKDKAVASKASESESESGKAEKVKKVEAAETEEQTETEETSKKRAENAGTQTVNPVETETASEGNKEEPVESAAEPETEGKAEEKGQPETVAKKREPIFAAEEDKVEVKFFIKEVWDKIFG
ncbi:stage II sporulation protein R [Bacillus benzoevorans]|uniref:Stage II sporulation protein R n=1 Tax=Bacillus benzoevorans TaxID=1456 RepID=A0A7X0LWJ1_9BACI|nr:stage II sporulation protein R [Bacillus benzoevorans]MBB6445557.1 stage II sporulation protein R [Bacillus benzoevorans]